MKTLLSKDLALLCRNVLAIALCLAVFTMFVLAFSSHFGGKQESESTWTATQDDSLDCLTMQVSGGNVIAMPGDGWASRDGFIQLQLAGSSVGGKRIESVSIDGSDLVVELAASESDSATLDLVLTEYRLEGGDAEAVSSVVLRDSGVSQTLNRAYK